MNSKDLSGKRYGRLIVIKFDSWYLTPSGINYSKWLCKCDCGKEVIVNRVYLRKGATKSCGCLRLERGKEFGRLNGMGLYTLDSNINALLYSYRKSAIDRGILFDLTKNEFKLLTKGNCFYCGQQPSQVKRRNDRKNLTVPDYIYNGIDRIDNKKGYNLDNCVSCCRVCNQMKMDLKFKDFLNHIRKLNKRFKIKKVKN